MLMIDRALATTRSYLLLAYLLTCLPLAAGEAGAEAEAGAAAAAARARGPGARLGQRAVARAWMVNSQFHL